MRLFFSFVLIILAEVAGVLPCAAQMRWHQEKGFKWAELEVPRDGRPGFTLLAPEQTGITFTNPLDERVLATNRVLPNGSGVALGDFDNDGLVDIFLCSLDGHNALYKNMGGMRFKDVTQASGIDCGNRPCRGAVFADINGDGRPDLVVAVKQNSNVSVFMNETPAGATAASFG